MKKIMSLPVDYKKKNNITITALEVIRYFPTLYARVCDNKLYTQLRKYEIANALICIRLSTTLLTQLYQQ